MINHRCFFLIISFNFVLFKFYLYDIKYFQIDINYQSFCISRVNIIRDIDQFPKIKMFIKTIFFHQNSSFSYLNIKEAISSSFLDSLNNLMNKFTCRFFCCKNCYLHSEMAFFDRRRVFINRTTCQRRFTIFSDTPICLAISQQFINKNVFSFHHQSGACYGHFLTDVIPKITLLPYFIIKKSYFITNIKFQERRFVEETYEIYGINRDQLIMGPSKLIFAKNAFIIETGECNLPNLFILNIFRKFSIPILGLDHFPAFRYILYNRKFLTKLHRRILNCEELFLLCHKLFPKYNFSLFDDDHTITNRSIKIQAKFFNIIKFLFAVDGAGLSNTLFMQKFTTLIEIFPNKVSYIGFFFISLSNSRFFVAVRDNKILLSSNSPNSFSPFLFVKIVNQTIRHEAQIDPSKLNFTSITDSIYRR
ncbi:hypothetical protein TRFO_35566 [Tritrichomonas foetus]|uniref:Glycosyltransferase 61 catalytic domain-containing protein n=1 Tax=Tritrichomonas foetus TaxID=1144522 RepID=A0A1J4JFZ2_9EUKA|nr:hypothetical protein TRFO_35566 [Tritrichomonas foetus]|eukprot:OHS98074.1 hypothetical protein TRFO_35566 [Tritrichomonas foetus]